MEKHEVECDGAIAIAAAEHDFVVFGERYGLPHSLAVFPRPVLGLKIFKPPRVLGAKHPRVPPGNEEVSMRIESNLAL